MNSDSRRMRPQSAPEEYSKEYTDRIAEELRTLVNAMMSPGVVRASNINISQIPTASTGLRSGDIWSNVGILTIVS